MISRYTAFKDFTNISRFQNAQLWVPQYVAFEDFQNTPHLEQFHNTSVWSLSQNFEFKDFNNILREFFFFRSQHTKLLCPPSRLLNFVCCSPFLGIYNVAPPPLLSCQFTKIDLTLIFYSDIYKVIIHQIHRFSFLCQSGLLLYAHWRFLK